MLLTDWHVLATAGDSIDGREISEQWLVEAAETYDPDFYEAVIDAEHDLEWFGSYGHVYDVRLGKNKNGETTLEGRLRPNMRCIEQYQRGQRLHFSIWIEEDFRNSGKAYLFRLALTDEPASVGTSRLNLFSIKRPAKFSTGNCIVTEPKALNLQMAGEEITLFRKFMDWLAPQNQERNPDNKFTEKNPEQDEDDMKPEQFSALTEQNKSIADALDKQAQAFTSLAEALKPTQEEDTPADQGGEEQQFSLADVVKKVDELNTKFEALKNTPAGVTPVPDHTGGNDGEKEFI